MDHDALRELNARYLWNPFTQMKEYLAEPPLVIERAHGVRLVDVDGREYLDGNSSLWLNVHGHRVPELDAALAEQLGRVAHTTLLGQGSVPAILLARRLVESAPGRLAKVFYSDSGATAVEIALKLAYAYWQRRGRPEKRRFLALRGGYHGDTIGAMAVGGIDLFHAEFGALFFETVKVPYPYSYRGLDADACLAGLRTALERADELACLAVEPLVAAAGGMLTMPPGFLAEVARLAREHDVLLLCDEVATGFGRTGTMYAVEREGVEPDLMTIGKGLTGGYLPVAATFATDEIYDAFHGDWAEGVQFFHGHSYTGNALGCAVALANLDLYERDGTVGRAARLGERLGALLAEHVQPLEHVGEVRRCGTLVGVELVADRASGAPFDWRLATGRRVCLRARELGLVTRPLGDVVTLVPPLATGDEDAEAMVTILARALAEVTAATAVPA